MSLHTTLHIYTLYCLIPLQAYPQAAPLRQIIVGYYYTRFMLSVPEHMK